VLAERLAERFMLGAELLQAGFLVFLPILVLLALLPSLKRFLSDHGVVEATVVALHPAAERHRLHLLPARAGTTEVSEDAIVGRK